jgi:hypothetical protein
MSTINESIIAIIQNDDNLIQEALLPELDFLFKENKLLLKRHQISQLLNFLLPILTWEEFQHKLKKFIDHQVKKDEKKDIRTWSKISAKLKDLLSEPEKAIETDLKNFLKEHKAEFGHENAVFVSNFNWNSLSVEEMKALRLDLAKRYLAIVKKVTDIRDSGDEKMAALYEKMSAVINEGAG